MTDPGATYDSRVHHQDAAANTKDLGRAIDARAATIEDGLIRLRRRLHAEPEPSGQERATTAHVAAALRDAGLEPRVMRDEVGVIADVEVVPGGPSFIALRADLDCVRVDDDKSVAYASTRAGLCHACGHDAHTSILVGVAGTIAELREEIAAIQPRHNIRFVFQPAEEIAAGARWMIDQGAIDGAAGILALHVDPIIRAGRIGLRNGYLTASAKRFQAVVRGRGGHSARPYETTDPIPAAAMLVSQFYQLCPRSVDSRDPVVITVGAMTAGSSFNVIPDDAVLEGSLRALSSSASERAQHRMEEVAAGVARSTGCTISLEFDHFCPPTDNDPALIGLFEGAAVDALGEDGVEWIERPSLGGEDFAYYQELIPGAMVRLGAALPAGRETPLHSNMFDIDESALAIGVRVLTRTAISTISHYNPPSL